MNIERIDIFNVLFSVDTKFIALKEFINNELTYHSNSQSEGEKHNKSLNEEDVEYKERVGMIECKGEGN